MLIYATKGLRGSKTHLIRWAKGEHKCDSRFNQTEFTNADTFCGRVIKDKDFTIFLSNDQYPYYGNAPFGFCAICEIEWRKLKYPESIIAKN